MKHPDLISLFMATAISMLIAMAPAHSQGQNCTARDIVLEKTSA